MKTLLVLIALLFCLSINAQRPGDLNTDFADGGIFLADWEDTISLATDIEIMPEGDLLIPGTYRANNIDLEEILAMEIDPEGNITPFGNCPLGFEYHIGSNADVAYASAVLPDGNILLTGVCVTTMPNLYPFVLRLSPEGELDESFDGDGVYISGTFQMSVHNMEVYQQAESYSIILCGETLETSPHPLMIMISDEGEFMTSFGTDGFLQLSEGVGGFVDLVVDNENDDLYAAVNLSGGGAALVKFNLPDGDLDTGFGIDGILAFVPATGFSGAINSIVLDKSDSTLAAFGEYPHPAGDDDIFEYRVKTTDGAADTSFGVAGFGSLRIPGKFESVKSAILQSDGKYYFGGSSNYIDTSDFFLGRINHDGTGDTSFGTNGLQLTARGSKEVIRSLALNEAEDMLYAAGSSSEDDSDLKIMVAAYHTTRVTETPPVGTVENLNSTMRLFPNPSTDFITIETGMSGPHQLQVFDMTGNTLINHYFTGGSCELNLQTLKPSVYFIQVTLPDKQVNTMKLIKH